VTEGGQEQTKKEGKGFAGLSSLVSYVDTTPPPAEAMKPAAVRGTGRPGMQVTQQQPSPRQQTYQETVQPASSGSSGGKWVLGIAAVIGVLWLVEQSGNSPTSHAPVSTFGTPRSSHSIS
jgi:hypothetical protein